MRSYAWDNEHGEAFRAARKNLMLVSRDEQQRLQSIHAASTVAEFLTGALDGRDSLWRSGFRRYGAGSSGDRYLCL